MKKKDEGKKYQIAVVLSHPIHYIISTLKALYEHPLIELKIYLCSDFGLREGYDTTFQKSVTWYSEEILKNLPHKFLKNYSPFHEMPRRFLSVVNPSIVQELKNEKFDAVLLYGYNYLTNWIALFAANDLKIPVMFQGESHLLNYRPTYIKAIKRLVLNIFFKKVSAFLAIGKLNMNYYLHYKIPSSKIFLSPYAVDNKFFQDASEKLAPKKEAIKNDLGIRVSLPVILFISKIIKRKGPFDLMQAYEPFKNDAALLFVGDGPEKIRLETYALENNMKNVYFAGFQKPTELPKFYSIADIFVLPSYFETWGLVINEAMNFGLPIITTTMVGSAVNLINYNENGFIYRPGDIPTLTKHLKKLLNDKPKRETMGRVSRKRINSWSHKESLEGIVNALQWIQTQE